MLKLNGATGAREFQAAYGDPGAQTGDAVVVNRFGTTTSPIAFVGTLNSSATFGPAGLITAVGSPDVFLVLARLE